MQNIVRLSDFRATAPLVELSVVVPCFNEKENVAALVEKLDRALPDVVWEAIFVDDDSPDGTADEVRRIAAYDGRVRCVRRIGRRGLSSACVEGFLSSSAPYVAVIDGDLQHDERILHQMLAAVREGEADVAVGSRYVGAGWTASGFDQKRQRISGLGGRLAGLVLKQPIADPMSGFFLLPRSTVDEFAGRLSGDGFKILLDILVTSPTPLRVVEVPYVFRARKHGESKLSIRVMFDFLVLLLDKWVGEYVPVRFLIFSAIGSLGLLVHLSVLYIAKLELGLPFYAAQAAATYIAMTCNFVLNNAITYGYSAKHGTALFEALVLWMGVCSVGAIANVGIATFLYQGHVGLSLSAIAGALVTALWNYAVSARLVWNRK